MDTFFWFQLPLLSDTTAFLLSFSILSVYHKDTEKGNEKAAALLPFQLAAQQRSEYILLF